MPDEASYPAFLQRAQIIRIMARLSYSLFLESTSPNGSPILIFGDRIPTLLDPPRLVIKLENDGLNTQEFLQLLPMNNS